MQVIELRLPQYTVDAEPNDKAIGNLIDNVIKQNFTGQTIVFRGIASSEHPGKSVDELIRIIQSTGTDRYDPDRGGDRYENIDNKHIDLFAFKKKVTPNASLTQPLIWGFYHSAKGFHGQPVRIDIISIYDASKLKAVSHKYVGRDDVKRDGFVFNNPDDKQGALLAIIKIT